MLTRLCAIALIALVLCPYTAPFQTCSLGDAPIVVIVNSAVAAPDDPAGVFVDIPPLQRRFTIAVLPGRDVWVAKSLTSDHLFSPIIAAKPRRSASWPILRL